MCGDKCMMFIGNYSDRAPALSATREVLLPQHKELLDWLALNIYTLLNLTSPYLTSRMESLPPLRMYEPSLGSATHTC